MSLFRSTSRLAPFRVAQPLLCRTFQNGSILRAGKETAEGNDARKQEIEHAKQEQLKEQKQGNAEWKQTLASESESDIKADRGDIKASKENISEMQKETAKAAEREKKGQ